MNCTVYLTITYSNIYYIDKAYFMVTVMGGFSSLFVSPFSCGVGDAPSLLRAGFALSAK